MSTFDEDLFLKGLEQRKATLGAGYVENNLAAADDFTRPFQEAMTAWCWGFGWGDDVIDPKTRSMMNLSMIGALGKMHEWETHCRGAIKNGVSQDEIRAIIHVIGIYCGACAQPPLKARRTSGCLSGNLLHEMAARLPAFRANDRESSARGGRQQSQNHAAIHRASTSAAARRHFSQQWQRPFSGRPERPASYRE